MGIPTRQCWVHPKTTCKSSSLLADHETVLLAPSRKGTITTQMSSDHEQKEGDSVGLSALAGNPKRMIPLNKEPVRALPELLRRCGPQNHTAARLRRGGSQGPQSRPQSRAKAPGGLPGCIFWGRSDALIVWYQQDNSPGQPKCPQHG